MQARGEALRAHIARAAAQLFYASGIHVVGVDRVAAAANVTKRTLYRHFRSKDELVAAALRAAPRVRFPSDGTPQEQIAGAFAALERFLTGSAYRGCPYILFAAELSDRRHPARVLIEELVGKRRAWFAERCAAAGAADPAALAEQLDVLFDGALAGGTKRSDVAPARAAAAAAAALLRAACLTTPRGTTT